jgi:DNA repair protein RadA/Sms
VRNKSRSVYRCSNCGHEEHKWLGRCPSCGEWNTLAEEAAAEPQTRRRESTTGRPVSIGSIDETENPRLSTGIAELDRVLGGGMVGGASVLVGGEPGIGKSTLMLQMAAQIRKRRVLYVTGEESLRQVKLRATRLGISNASLEILAESRLESILKTIRPRRSSPSTAQSGAAGSGGQRIYDVVIIDSIQTVHSDEVGSVPGSPNQIKYAAFEIADQCREAEMTAFLVAHLTKEGNIAGPRTIEHMVDTVLYFEQSDDNTRYLRASKNRFGSVDEIGLFTMQSSGLVQITDPGSVFLVQREGVLPAGVVVAPVIEGSRVLLVEVQALTVPAKGGISRVFSDRVDTGRVNRMAAVLEKHIGMSFTDQDVYVNVAGGIRIRDVGVDLPLAVALYSARSGRPFPAATTVAGEVSLAGEIRPVGQMSRRARTAREMGFETCLGPIHSRDGEGGTVTWRSVDSLKHAIDELFE